MEFVSKINRAKILFFVFAIIFGGFTGQVNAATEKPVTKPSLLSVCINPAKTKTRAAQDDRCTDKNTGTNYESLPAKTASSSTRSNQSLPPLPALPADAAKATTATTVPAAASVADTPGANATASVVNAAGGIASISLSAALSVMPSSATSSTVPTKPVKPVKTTVPVKPKNKNGTSAVGTTVPVVAAVTTVSNISTGAAGSTGTSLPVEVPGLISVCVNKSTSVLRDTADNSCSSGSEVKVEWLDSGASPKICVNNNNREMTLAQDGKCATKNSAVADVTVNKQILACADDKTGVLRYQKSGNCGVKADPVVWVLKDQGVARNVDDAVKKGVVEIISLIPTTGGAGGTSSGANTGGSTKTVTTSPATNASSATTTTTAAPTLITTTTSTTTTTSSTTTSTTTTVASRVSGSFAGYLGGNCPDGSGIPWYWGSDGNARAGGCSAAASIAPTTTAPATTTTAVSATTTTTVAPVIPGTPGTPTGVAGNAQVTVSVTAGTGGTPTSYTITQSTTSGGTYSAGCTVTGASGSCVVTGLTNGTTYFFKTTATNSAGTSGLSTASSSVTPATVPGAPTIGTATVASATSVTVACTTPASNGGATITTYTATSNPGSRTGTLTSATCSSAITVTGLTTGTAYTFTVTATNSAGTSVASAASNSVTPTITCATGGTCVVGDTGPLGGKVYYVASSTFTCGSTMSSTCRYLEWDTTSYATSPTATTYWCNNLYTGASSVPNISGTSTAIGAGLQNTRLMRAGCTSGIANDPSLTNAQYASGWHIPSYLELDTLRNARSTAIGYATSNNGEWYTSSQTGSTLNGRSEWFDSGGTTDSKGNAIPSLRVSAFNSTP